MMLRFYLFTARDKALQVLMLECVQVTAVCASMLNYTFLSFLAFTFPTCMILQASHLLVLSILAMGLIWKKPSLLLPNLLFKGCFASCLLFLGLQGVEQKTMTPTLLGWFALSTLLAIFEMHYMLSWAFKIADDAHKDANGPPTYKEVRLEDGALPSYEAAMKAVEDGTAKVPTHKGVVKTVSSEIAASSAARRSEDDESDRKIEELRVVQEV